MIRDTSATDRTISVAPQSRKRLWTAIAAVLVVILLTGFAMPAVGRWFSASRSISAERLRTAVVRRGNLVRDISVPGRVVAAVSPTLYSPAAGSVSLLVKAGDSVAVGQVLAQVESPELTNQWRQEKAQLQSLEIDEKRGAIDLRKKRLTTQQGVDQAQIALNTAKRELERAQSAWTKGVISELDLRKAEDGLKTAQVNSAHAEADARLEGESLDFEQQTKKLTVERQRLKVEELSRVVDRLAIKSPVDGVIGNVAVIEKAAVALNQALLTVVDLSQLDVDVQIGESYAHDLGIGMTAEVKFGSEKHAATLTAISPEITNGQVSGRVRFKDGQPQTLRQSQRVDVRILIEEKPDVLMVARGPFVDTGGGRIAYVVKNGVAEKRSVQIGATSVSDVEVLSGLVVGDEIVVSGTDEFKQAEKVLIAR